MLLALFLSCVTLDIPDTDRPCLESTRVCWWDNDGDGFGVEPYDICADPWESRPEGCRVLDGDCDDEDPDVYPGQGCDR